MTRVLGVDPSLTSTGIAVVFPDGDPYTAAFKTAGKRDAPLADTDDRLRRITDFVAEHLDGADLVVIEGPSLGSHGGSQWDRAGLWWRIVHRLIAQERRVAVCPPKVRSKFATGVGGGPKASKAAVAVAVSRLWPACEAETDDEWDALGMATMGAQRLGWDVPQRAHHADALSGVSWPAVEAVAS